MIMRQVKHVFTPYEEAASLNFQLRCLMKPQLQKMCKDEHITGFSQMNRMQMRHAILRKKFSWSKDWSEDWLLDWVD